MQSEQHENIDSTSTALLADLYDLAHRAPSEFALESTARLWPEHFDLGITVDRVNYGVSPGDAMIPQPYPNVGPWDVPAGAANGSFDMPFGAARVANDGRTTVADPVAFLTEGRARARVSP